MKCAITIGILITLLLWLGVAGLAVGVGTTSWWKQFDDDIKIEEGLWKTTVGGSPRLRQWVLTFEREERDKDIVMLLLIIGATFGGIAAVTIWCILYDAKNNPGLSVGETFWIFLLPFLTVCVSATGVIYSEIQFKDKWNEDVDKGYSVLLVYIGISCLILAMLLSICLLVSSAKEARCDNHLAGNHNQQRSSGNMRSIKGYELR